MKKLIVLLLLSIPALAQTGAYTGSPVINGVGQPIASASVAISTTNPCGTSPTYTFCNGQPQGIYTGTTPPGDLATIYLDTVVTTTIPNPILTDPLGNWTVYAPAGVYWATIYGYQIVPQVEAIQIGGGGGGIPFACASAVNGSIVGMTSTTTSSCDPNGVTDFIGHWTSQSYRATGAFNGVVELTGGLADPTGVPDTNSVAFLAPLSVPTPYYVRPPSSVGAVGQCLGLLSQNIGTNGTIDALQWQSCLASPTTFQTNGVNNLSQSILNIVQGANCTVTNTSGGNVTVTCTGAAAPPQASNPSAPTITVQGTPGATTYSYQIVCNERYDGSVHSAVSAQGSTSTGNASLTTSNKNLLTGYADALYGYRNCNAYRVTGGASQGKIATGIGKSFTDTGLVADGISPSGITNNTQLDQHCLGSANPVGLNVIPGTPCGIDAPPTTPAALDDEMGPTFQVPGDVNDPFWTWLNQSTATAAWTGGLLSITSPGNGAADNNNCLFQTAPATPYTFVAKIYWNISTVASSNNGALQAGIAFSDGTKLLTWYANPNFPSGAGNVLRLISQEWTNATTSAGTFPGASVSGTATSPIYLKIQNDGTNLNFWSSVNEGIVWQPAPSIGRTAFFGSGPTKVGFCLNANTNAGSMEVDYWRETQ